MTHYIHLYR